MYKNRIERYYDDSLVGIRMSNVWLKNERCRLSTPREFYTFVHIISNEKRLQRSFLFFQNTSFHISYTSCFECILYRFSKLLYSSAKWCLQVGYNSRLDGHVIHGPFFFSRAPRPTATDFPEIRQRRFRTRSRARVCPRTWIHARRVLVTGVGARVSSGRARSIVHASAARVVKK